MMGSASSGNKTLKLLEFLADPEKAKHALEQHQAAASDHRQAAELANKLKDEADIKLSQLQQAFEQLNEREEALNKRQDAMDIASQQMISDRQILKAREDKLNEDRNELIKMKQQAATQANQTTEQAKLQAALVLKEQQDIVDRITKQALQKDLEAEQKYQEWTRRLADLKSREDVLAEREIALTKREQKLRELLDI